MKQDDVAEYTGEHRQGRHAVVLGGSMSGLLAARVLADHFDRVTIVERDRFPESPAPRKGVPQARHVHVLLSRGRQIMERYFPGLMDELTEAGAPFMDAAQDVAWLSAGGWAARFPSEFGMAAASRDLLEWTVRRRLTVLPQVEFIEGADVIGLRAEGDKVIGVTIRLRAGDEEKHLHAELVVDATGRGSRAPQWLAALGYAGPQETVVNSHLGYASRMYRAPEGFDGDWAGLYIQGTPPLGTRNGLILAIEGQRWLVTLAGRSGDYPPIDEDGFLDFASSLPSPKLYEAIKDAEPLGSIHGYRGTENRLRHFERMARFPEGFIVLGDAVCAFNPVYGQGMSTAAIAAETLDRLLRRRPNLGRGFAHTFQKQLARAIAAPWLLATTEDFRFPGTEGSRPGWLTRLQLAYVDRVIRLSTKKPWVRRRFLAVLHLIKSPRTLFSPKIGLALIGEAFSRPKNDEALESPLHRTTGFGIKGSRRHTAAGTVP